MLLIGENRGTGRKICTHVNSSTTEPIWNDYSLKQALYRVRPLHMASPSSVLSRSEELHATFASPRQTYLLYTLDSAISGLQCRCRRSEEKKKFLYLLRIKLRYAGHPALMVFTILTELTWLYIAMVDC